MAARHGDSAGHEIVAYNVASLDDDPAPARSRVRDTLVPVREPNWRPHISMLDFASELAELRRSTGSPAALAAALPDGRGGSPGHCEYARTAREQLAARRRGPRGPQSRLPRTRRLPGLTRPDTRTVEGDETALLCVRALGAEGGVTHGRARTGAAGGCAFTRWSPSSPARPAPPGGRRSRSPTRRSTPSTTAPGTPTRRTWPAPTTGAGSGRCRSPERRRVARGHVASAAVPCCRDRRGLATWVRSAESWLGLRVKLVPG